MKKIYVILTFTFLTTFIFAQAPERMSYQAVIRNSENKLVANKKVGIQISILQGSATGTAAIYTERHTTTTNANGLASIEIGAGTTSDDFDTIKWANGPFFIKTETDPTGGTSYSITGTSQLLSVPYALHSKTVDNVTETDITNWNNKQEKLIAGEGVNIINNVITTTNQSELLYHPYSANRGNSVKVSFSGGSDISFVQATPAILKFEQATPIYPSNVYYVNNKKVDVEFQIPWDVATGTYDIIINPYEVNPNIIERAFLILWGR